MSSFSQATRKNYGIHEACKEGYRDPHWTFRRPYKMLCTLVSALCTEEEMTLETALVNAADAPWLATVASIAAVPEEDKYYLLFCGYWRTF